jgi:hypothetical protein
MERFGWIGAGAYEQSDSGRKDVPWWEPEMHLRRMIARSSPQQSVAGKNQQRVAGARDGNEPGRRVKHQICYIVRPSKLHTRAAWSIPRA